MDDRLKARLRAVADPAEPRPEFVEQLHDTLASKLQFPVATDTREREAPTWRAGRPWVLAAATIALTLALVGSALIAGGVVDRLFQRPAVLDELRSTSIIRVAVRPDHPQTRVPGGALAGFDIDVARALGDRLALDTELAVIPLEEMVGGRTRAWDIAMPSTWLPSESMSDVESTSPYYYWPFYVLVPSSSTASEMADLEGEAICVVAGSTGEAWLAGSTNDAQLEAALSPAANTVLRTLEDDGACLADMDAGASAAVVTATLVEADLTSRPDYRVLGGSPAGWERRVVIVSAERGDPTSLVAALNDAIAGMRRDGSLKRFSELRFGGQDLSEPPR